VDKKIFKKILSGITIEEKIGQMFQVDFTGTKVTPDLKDMMVELSKWKKDYKTGKFFENTDVSGIARLELKVRELERLVCQLTIENRMLMKARDLDTKKKKKIYP